MEALSTKTLELSARNSGRPAAARLFYGNYGYYLDRVEREEAGGYEIPNELSRPAELPVSAAKDVTIDVTSPAPAPLPRTILIKAGERRAADKQRQTLIRRLQRQEAEILKALEELEKEKTWLEGELVRPEIYSSGEKTKATKARLDKAAAELESKNREWEGKAAELEAAVKSVT
jgi:ATP-binding cassette subfamily F protein 3